MNIYVCVKHVPDSAATITIQGPDTINDKITFLVNPYDEHAVTEAARIKMLKPGVEVVAVCLGPAAAKNSLRSAMAMGADRAILIENQQPADSILTAHALSAAITADGAPWIILTGKESIDYEGMQTQFRIAARLGLPVATNVVMIAVDGDALRVECEREPGTIDTIRLTAPCVLGAGKGLNTPNYPTFPDIVKSRKKPLKTIKLADLDFLSPSACMRIEKLEPVAEKRSPKALTGSAKEIAASIVSILKNKAKVI
jgi:electron transfer flavoprotein beta subunit